MRLGGRVAIVTGASRGIGAATAVRLAAEGANVVVNYAKDEKAAARVVDRIKKAGRRAIAVRADVSKADHVARLVETTLREFGRIDILVNNAGVISAAPPERLTEAAWREVLDVNLLGVWFCSRAVGPLMAKAGRGKIINISSVYGALGATNVPHYCAAKAGVDSLTRSLARWLAPAVQVNAIAPGNIATEMTARAGKPFIMQVLEGTLLRRLGEPEEIAGLVAFLASDDANFITGQTIIADGGYSLK